MTHYGQTTYLLRSINYYVARGSLPLPLNVAIDAVDAVPFSVVINYWLSLLQKATKDLHLNKEKVK